MPYSVRSSGGKFQVIVNHSGRVLGTHDSKESAAAQLAAVCANDGEKHAQKGKKKMRAFVLHEVPVTLAASAMGATIPLLAHAADAHSLLPYALSLLNAFGPTILLVVLRWRRARLVERQKQEQAMLADANPKNDNDALNMLVQDTEEKAVLDVVEGVATEKGILPKDPG